MDKTKTIKIDKKPKKGTYCLRCGMDKKEIRIDGRRCSHWGTSYPTHIYK